MKALTVWQPWASLLAQGVKRHETRSWTTDYRGRLAIHAAKRVPRTRELRLPGMVTAMLDAGLRDEDDWSGGWELPLGKVLAVAELVDVHEVDQELVHRISDRERRLGDFSRGQYAWELEIVRRLDPPVPVRGNQRLWTWKPESEELVE